MVNNEQPFIECFLDLLANQPKCDEGRAVLKQILQQRFNERLEECVERVWDVPPIMLKREGEYLELLLETRELYLSGYFYSCVAMCGIVGERLIKDTLRESVLIQSNRSILRPSDPAFDQLERVEVSGITRFLKEAGVLPAEVAKASIQLIELRNQYAHARGAAPQSDALKAISLLHVIVEEVVSVFRDYEMKDGALVRKGADAEHQEPAPREPGK